MDFSEALSAVKDGHRIRREGWSEDSYVVLQPGYPDGIEINANTAASTGVEQGTRCVFDPYLMAWNGNAQTFGPWVPTMRDLLVNDWSAAPVR